LLAIRDLAQRRFEGLKRTLLLLLLSGSIGGIATSSGSTASGSGGTTTGADVHEEVLDILALKSLFAQKFIG
jgi:hypothetical protein